MMSWNSHDPQVSKFSTTTPQAHNNVLPVYTHSPVSVPYNFTYGTIYLPPPLNGQPSPESVTPTVNSMPRNKPPKPVKRVPIDPDLYPSFSDSYLMESSDSDSRYSKRGQHTRNKC